MKRVRGVLFDFYDTLARIDAPVIERGRRELAALAGLTLDELAALWRQNREDRLLGTAGDLSAQLRAMLRSVGRDPAPALLGELVDLEYRSWQWGVRLYADVVPALVELRRRGFKVGILSNCTCQAGAMVGFLGLRSLVESVVLSFEVGLAKPDPAIYRGSLIGLGLQPGECAFIADGAGRELEGGQALGLATIKIRRANTRLPEDLTIQADHRIETLEELLRVLSPES